MIPLNVTAHISEDLPPVLWLPERTPFVGWTGDRERLGTAWNTVRTGGQVTVMVSRRAGHLDLETTKPPPAPTTTNLAVGELGLARREAEILILLTTGQTNRQIASTLFISEKTASAHVTNILRKLEVSSRLEAAAVGQRLKDRP